MRVVVSALLIAEVAMQAPKDHSSGYPGGCATLRRPDGDDVFRTPVSYTARSWTMANSSRPALLPWARAPESSTLNPKPSSQVRDTVRGLNDPSGSKYTNKTYIGPQGL